MKKLRASKEDPENKLQDIETQIKHLYSLLTIWTHYVNIIYMPIDELSELQNMRVDPLSKEGGDDDADTSQDILRQKEAQMKIGYMSVEEPVTSDTAESEEPSITDEDLNFQDDDLGQMLAED